MSKTKKRGTVLAVAGAVTAVAIGGGVAWAAFLSTGTATAANGTTATFGPTTVEGEWASPADGQKMLPGKTANVKIKLKLPETNDVSARVKSIVGQPLTKDDIIGPEGMSNAAKTTCAGWITPKSSWTPNIIVSKDTTEVVITLDKAVTFSPDMTQTCSGIKFTPKWEVITEATDENGSTDTAYTR